MKTAKRRAQKAPKKKDGRRALALATGSGIGEDRAMQIINNVAEEYADLGLTNFATKAELCETIRWLRNHDGEEWQRMQSTISEIATLCYTRLLRADVPKTSSPNDRISDRAGEECRA